MKVNAQPMDWPWRLKKHLPHLPLRPPTDKQVNKQVIASCARQMSYPRAARDELEKPRTHLLGVALDDHPEPLHHRRLGVAVLQARVGLPVLDVDFSNATC
jgi:hypothetical protein